MAAQVAITPGRHKFPIDGYGKRNAHDAGFLELCRDLFVDPPSLSGKIVKGRRFAVRGLAWDASDSESDPFVCCSGVGSLP